METAIVYWGYIGMTEKEMETIILLGFRVVTLGRNLNPEPWHESGDGSVSASPGNPISGAGKVGCDSASCGGSRARCPET